MARLKKVYTDKKYELDRKRDRILKYVFYSWASFLALGIVVMGCFQGDPTVVGVGVILEGAATLACVAFRIYTRIKGWEIMTVYDEPELRKSRHMMWESYLKEKERLKNTWAILDVLLVAVGLGFVVAGVLKLRGII